MSSLPPPAPPGPPGPPPIYPGPPGYSGMPTAHRPPTVRSLRKLSRWLLVLLAASAGLQVINLPVILAVRSKALDYLDRRISRDTFQDTLNRQTAINVPVGGVQIAIFVLTIIWMYRLAENHRALGRPGSVWSPGWAIGGWFTPPGFAYVVPWLMFRELWKGSDPTNVPNDPTWKRRRSTPVLTAWWIVYGFTPILAVTFAFGGISFRDTDSATDRMARNYRDRFALQFTATILTIVAAGLFAKLVYDLTRRQQALTGEP